jgi:hypothetical protein
MRTQKLLKKPLRDHLKGLMSRVDLLPSECMQQPIIDSVMFLVIELSRIDQTGARL